jgi:filamentous hemagglutinin family protein
LTGPDFEISATLGSTRGANLFHSFQTFSIDTGESATFTGPGSIDNVISRVTGGEVSSIDGLLRSEVGTADFYFINPAGVMFGPNAQVDVPAAFHVSTADELRFQDGAVFSASAPDSSALSVASPESFGFLSPQPASLTVNGSQLEFAPASRVTMVANDVTVQNGASLNNESGAIRVTAVGESETTVDVASGSTDSTVDGAIEIRGSSALNASGTLGTETVELRGGAIEVEDSLIAADNSGAEDGVGRILLEADSISVINGGVRTRISGTGQGNDILLVADRVSLLNGGQLVSDVDNGAAGTGGMVEIQATDAVTIEGVNSEGLCSGIYTTSYSEVDADGGSIFVDAPQALITIDDGGRIQTGTAGAGDAGSVTIDANDLLIQDEGIILTCTEGSGNAGAIEIDAEGNVTIDEGTLDANTYNFGKAGDIHLVANDAVLMTENSQINAYSYEPPNDLRFGDAGNVSIDTGFLSMLDSCINVSSYGRANAGTIEVIADDIHVDNTTGDIITSFDAHNTGYDILTENSTLDTEEEGRTGSITLEAANITFDHGANMSIVTNVGDGGFIDIRADELNLLNGSKLSADSWGPGHGGDVHIDVSGTFLIQGGLSSNVSTYKGGICTQTFEVFPATGPAGDITITAGNLVVGQDSLIKSSSASNVTSGKITLNLGTLVVKDGGEISASALSEGPAAEIVITAQEAIRIYGVDPIWTTSPSEISANGAFSGADGTVGSILIDTPLLVLERGGRLMAENGGGGVGGAITLSVNELVMQSGGAISTSNFGESGVAGTIQIDANYVSINQEGSEFLHPLIQQTGLFSGSLYFTDSAGRGDAGIIAVTANEIIELHSGAQIATNAIDANGGPIIINGGILLVDDSHITTSVSGETGNGGDITLSPNLLVLNGGFIQANTSASQASGGDISIDTNTIIASSGNVQVGGTGAIFQPGSGINVIQAAAPDGVQGDISITAPELDISGTLVSLASGLLEPARLSSDSCASLAEEAPSTLVQGGRGGVPAGPESSAGVTFAGYRLDRLLSTSFAPNGKVDGSVAISNGNEPDVAGNQAVLCQDGSDAGSLQYMLLH